MQSYDRQLKVLKHIVEIFILTGEPASSLAVCERFFKTVSSATIRNDMKKLEEMGFLQQPHTSAGRFPTHKGFKFYVDSLMKFECLAKEEKQHIDELLEKSSDSVSTLVESASSALADFTKLAVVSINDVPNFFVVCKVDIVKTGRRVFAVFIVASSGEIKNKICRLRFDIGQKELEFFKKVVNESMVGSTVDVLDDELVEKMAIIFGSYFRCLMPLLKALKEISSEILKKQINIKGEENLLKYDEAQAKKLMEFVLAKNKIEKILTSAFSGINVLFGKENDIFALENSSLILAKYSGLKSLGSFGVVGPVRLNYERVLPYVSYFSEKMSSLIKTLDKEIQGGGGLWRNNQTI